MQTANLSQLALSPYFFDFLDEERIHFDRILSDSNSETQHKNFIFLNKPLTSYQNIKKSDHILLILWKLSPAALLAQINEYENITLLNCFDGICSFGKKNTPQIESYLPLQQSGFKLFFPFDQNQFSSFLQKSGKIYLSLSNFEIAENIYTFSEDDQLSFIDKALAEQPENIALINNPEAEYHIISFGNYFEEMVKLSEYLLAKERAYHLSVLASFSQLSTPDFLQQSQKAKKLIILIDQLPTQKLKELLRTLLKTSEEKIHLLSPEYPLLTTILPEYLLEQTQFDALHLNEKIKNIF